MITEHIIGKKSYIRKDGNKLGRKKEKREMLNISTKHFENDFEKRNTSRYNTFHGFRGLNTLLSGGLKRGEMITIGVGVFKDHHDDYHTSISHTIAMEAIERNNKICIVDLENENREGLKRVDDYYNIINGFSGERPEIIMVNDIPYNPMDEFDRPWIYDNDREVVSLVSERYIHHIGDNHKYMYPDSISKENLTYNLDKVSIDAISAWKNNNAINFCINKDKQYYKECNVTDGEYTINVDKRPELDSIDLFKESLNKYFEYNHYEHINTESLVKVIDDILAKDNKEVLVIDKEEDGTYFSKTDDRYKSVIVTVQNLEVQAEEAIFIDSYTTIQESLLKLLESIKGNEEFLITYKHIDKVGVCGIISRKEWYMKKSKITLDLPDWLIEPKDVYTYMSGTGISDEEKEDTLSKRLDKLLEGTVYKWTIEEKMVPDTERTMLYTIRLNCGVFVTCVNELDNKTYYTKLEALAEAYKAIYNFKKEGYLKFNKDDENNILKPLDGDTDKPKYDSSLPLGVTSLEDLSNWSESSGFKFEYSKPEILNVGRGHTKPFIMMDVSLEDLLAVIINLLPENSYPSIISLEDKKYVACIVDDNGDMISKEPEEYTTASQAFSMLYTRLVIEKDNNESKKD